VAVGQRVVHGDARRNVEIRVVVVLQHGATLHQQVRTRAPFQIEVGARHRAVERIASIVIQQTFHRLAPQLGTGGHPQIGRQPPVELKLEIQPGLLQIAAAFEFQAQIVDIAGGDGTRFGQTTTSSSTLSKQSAADGPLPACCG